MERFILVIILMSIYCSCSSPVTVSEKSNNGTVSIVDSSSILAQPYATESAKKFSKAIGWADGNMPVAPEGFVVQKFSDKLENPRWIYVLPNGDVLIAEAGTKGALKAAAAFVSGNSKSRMSSGSADRITLFRDANKDGIFEMREVFLKDLNQPLGMVLVGEIFYVANTDGVVAFPYKQGQTNITATGKKITDLPANGYNNHWTRNLITNKSKDKLFIKIV